MITAEQAFAKAIIPDAFYQYLTTEIEDAIRRKDLFVKIDVEKVPLDCDLDAVLGAVEMLGYNFVRVDNGHSIVIDFSFSGFGQQPEEE